MTEACDVSFTLTVERKSRICIQPINDHKLHLIMKNIDWNGNNKDETTLVKNDEIVYFQYIRWRIFKTIKQNLTTSSIIFT